MKCQCEELNELFGNKAEDYANNHLLKILVDASKWETEYRCPEKGITWIMDFPQSYLQGGGPPRLRKIVKKYQNQMLNISKLSSIEVNYENTRSRSR